MVRAELMGSHTHTAATGVNVHVWRRGETYLVRGRWQARAFGEDILLARWAAASRRGDRATAAAALSLAAALGRQLSQARGEGLLADAVSAIERGASSPAAQRDRVIEGLLAEEQGVV